jgi:hypothetical protein
MLRVAGRAPDLLDLIVEHGHDHVVCQAALTRTVVIENVTWPKPALLH